MIKANIKYRFAIIIVNLITVFILLLVVRNVTFGLINKRQTYIVALSEFSIHKNYHKHFIKNLEINLKAGALESSMASPDSCLFGQWLNSPNVKSIEKVFPQLKSNFDNIDKDHRLIHNRVYKLYEIEKNDTTPGKTLAQEYLNNEIIPIHHELLSELEDVDKTLKKQDQIIEGKIFRINLSIFLLIVFIVIFSIILSISTGLHIKRSIEKFKIYSDKLKNGELTAKVNLTLDDELKEIMEIIHSAMLVIAERMEDVIMFTDNVKSMSEQLAESSDQLSSGATEQAASIEEIATTMEEIVSVVESNLGNSDKAKERSNEAAQLIQKDKENLTKLDNAIRSISEKVSAITEIASKIDMLAINASIEAARAGESGKGFAVVAQEIRKLSVLTKKAAEEIIELSEASVEISNATFEDTNEVFEKMEKIIDFIVYVHGSLKEQLVAIENISGGVQQLSTVAQQNASTAEEFASSSEELSSQSENLKDYLNFFKLKNDTEDV